MKRLPGSKSERASLQDSGEAWLLATGGITRPVVLIELSPAQGSSIDPAVSWAIGGEEETDADTPTDPADPLQSVISAIRVMWRPDLESR